MVEFKTHDCATQRHGGLKHMHVNAYEIKHLVKVLNGLPSSLASSFATFAFWPLIFSQLDL